MTAREQCVNILGKFPEERLPYVAVLLENAFKMIENAPTLDEQLAAALKRVPAKEYRLEANEHGHLIIDKDLHPELYDWAVNG